MAEKTMKEKLSVKDKWFRLIFMVICGIAAWVARMIIWVITILQFLYTLFVGRPLKNLLPFSESLGTYVYEIAIFLTYVTEKKPFPFSPWPSSKIKEEKVKPIAARVAAPKKKVAPKKKAKGVAA